MCRGCSFGTEEFRSIISEIESAAISEITPEITEEIKYRIGSNSKNNALTVIGMTLLFFISFYNIAKYIRLRRK